MRRGLARANALCKWSFRNMLTLCGSHFAKRSSQRCCRGSLQETATIVSLHAHLSRLDSIPAGSKPKRHLFRLKVNVFPAHLHAAAGVNLQADHAIRKFRRRVGKVHNLCAIEQRHDVRAVRDYFQLIPLTGLQSLFALRRRLRHPAAAAAFVQTASVLAYVGIHLHLHSLNVRPMLRVNSQNLRAKKHAAVACRLSFELESKGEILVRLFCSQIPVFVGRALAEDGSLLHHPLFVAILLPAAEILPIEERNPAAFLWRLSQCAQTEE